MDEPGHVVIWTIGALCSCGERLCIEGFNEAVDVTCGCGAKWVFNVSMRRDAADTSDIALKFSNLVLDYRRTRDPKLRDEALAAHDQLKRLYTADDPRHRSLDNLMEMLEER